MALGEVGDVAHGGACFREHRRQQRVAVDHAGAGLEAYRNACAPRLFGEIAAVVEQLVVLAGVDEQRREAGGIAETWRHQRIVPIMGASVVVAEDRP